MFTNYVKIAWRTLRKQGGYTAINVIGLALGLACCLLITLYVVDELSYDRFNAKADRIYRLHSDIKFGGEVMNMAVTPDPLGPTLKQDYPQVEQFTRLHQQGTWSVSQAGTTSVIREDNITFADSTVFDVFTLPLLAGRYAGADPKRALAQPNSVVISEAAATRHFGSQNPIGQTLLFNKMPYKVTALMRDMPTNSHFRADFLLAMSSDDYQWGQWVSNNHHTYVVLRPGVDADAFARNLDAVAEKYVGPQILSFLGSTMAQFRQANNRFAFTMMPLTDIHLHSKQTIQLAPVGDIRYVYIFSAVALFILLIAGINFMNLATARSANRAKEVGVRKVLGSGQGQLLNQFMTESVLTTAMAMLLAVGLVAAALPLFNDIAAKQLTFRRLITPFWLVMLPVVPLVVGLLAGVYPAIFLSSYRPIAVLKGKIIARSGGALLSSARLRSGLVVFQFMMSVLLIIGTIVVYRQMRYIQTKNLGFNREQMLVVNGTDGLGKQTETFRQVVLQLPGVVNGTVSGYLPTPSNRSNTSFFPEGQIEPQKAVSMQNWSVDYDYVKTMGMQLVQGRDFSRSFGADSSGIILNETAAKLFGGKAIIGKRIAVYADVVNKLTKSYTVIGVVKNFNYESLRQEVGALALILQGSTGSISFRLNGSSNVAALVSQIEANWKRLAPGQAFSYAFLDDNFDQMYRTEQRVGTLTLVFSVLAVLIACLGLFGLAAYTAEQRTKEIGVRKVLGASVTSVVALLSQDFLKLVLIAIVIASPVAWWAMHRWLADFAYRVDIEWWVFALAGVLAVGIALLTVSVQSIKAALVNPVKSLRSE
ncbi:ABC transporter permease [Fibrella sp. HMF5335]|uniref:ABC transporter permease n=1 Tax=Fibrella rubiginis TaxID=2817060 RepID=A0A939GIN9_9BACT|nr:ABC transporter permease [Fibrella rubiginis]MBO0937461.1 ABC transporter permease [Fibrella rubiginis]